MVTNCNFSSVNPSIPLNRTSLLSVLKYSTIQQMETTANHFRQNLKSHVDRCARNHEILKVNRKRGNDFVVLSASDWQAVEETLHINHVPGLVQKIHNAAKEPLSQGTKLKDFKW